MARVWSRCGFFPPGLGLVLLIAAAVPLARAARGADVEYVIHVSVDGVNASTLEELIEDDTSGDFEHFQRLIDEGASTFNARADYSNTSTLPNHVSMVSGRPVSQPAGQPDTVHHGYTDNAEPDPEWTLHNHGNPNLDYIASVWDVAHDNGLSTAHYASKSKFVIFEWSYDADSGAPDPIPPDDGTDKIDTYLFKASQHFDPAIDDAYELHQDFLDDMASERFNYTFLCYTDPDKAGHQYGWGSSQYDDTLRHVDDYLGDILDLVEGDSLLDGHTVVIVTSDHGGTGYDHSNPVLPANYTIPYFVWGPGVDAGADLYSLNSASRTDPGTGRPDYNAAGQPIRHVGSGNLALDLLGLGPIPGSSVNADQDLIVGSWGVEDIPVPAGSLPGRLLLGFLVVAAGLALLSQGPARGTDRRGVRRPVP